MLCNFFRHFFLMSISLVMQENHAFCAKHCNKKYKPFCYLEIMLPKWLIKKNNWILYTLLQICYDFFVRAYHFNLQKIHFRRKWYYKKKRFPKNWAMKISRVSSISLHITYSALQWANLFLSLEKFPEKMIHCQLQYPQNEHNFISIFYTICSDFFVDYFFIFFSFNIYFYYTYLFFQSLSFCSSSNLVIS